jgi:ABC-type nitrate/sulfonate/bicarbonate transport system permease component
MTADAPVAPRSRRVRRRSLGIAPLRGLLPLALLLVVWQVIGMVQSSTYFPPPSTWVQQLGAMLVDGSLLPSLGQTLLAFALSLVIATVLGTILGTVIGRVAVLDRLLGPILDYFRFLPAVVVVPLVVLFAGYTTSMELFVVVFGAVWPVLLQVRLSAREIDPLLLDVRRMLRLGPLATLGKVILPSVAPGAMLGLVITAPLTLVLALMVEISTQVSGLGKMLADAQASYVSAKVFALVVVVGVIALVINVVLRLIEAWLFRYRPPAG